MSALLADNIVIQFITSEAFTRLVEPFMIVVIIGFMIYASIKPRIEASNRVNV